MTEPSVLAPAGLFVNGDVEAGQSLTLSSSPVHATRWSLFDGEASSSRTSMVQTRSSPTLDSKVNDDDALRDEPNTARQNMPVPTTMDAIHRTNRRRAGPAEHSERLTTPKGRDGKKQIPIKARRSFIAPSPRFLDAVTTCHERLARRALSVALARSLLRVFSFRSG
jgi:hypothetical protein